MEWLTGGEALVKSLSREGIEVVFGLPGVQLYGVIAALRDEPGIRLITTRHEQATSYMADGYARASGGLGTALVVPGPGLLNASAGLSTAYAASSPVLMIAGQVPKGSIGKNIGMLHEVNDQQDAIRPVTKWRRRVVEVEDVAASVQEAVYQLRTGRPRPVEIELPPETMEEEGEAELLEPKLPARPSAPTAELERAAERLLNAPRVVIYAGGGVHASGAHEALLALAEHLQAPVVQTPEGKGAISDHSDLCLGATLTQSPTRELVDSADVVLAVGTRLALASLQPDQQVIQIDVDEEEIGRNHPKTLGLVGDARAILEDLLERLRAASAPRDSGKAERNALRAALQTASMDEPQTSIVRSLREGAPEETIVVAGMTQIGYYTRPVWPVYHPRTYLTSSYAGNLGFEYPTALGAKVARPDRPVIAIVGDGGFLYNAQEMATAVKYNINVIAVVFNDNSYGNVARDLDEAWGGDYQSELHNPDFMKLADAFGVVGMRTREPTDVGDLVRKAVDLDRPVLIEVPVGRMPRPMFFPARRKPTKYQR